MPGMLRVWQMAVPPVKMRLVFATAALGRMYLAYLRDPAGNKICALLRMG